MKEIIKSLFKQADKSKDNQLTLKIMSSVYPNNRPPENEWFKEFRVGMLHGKQVVHFG